MCYLLLHADECCEDSDSHSVSSSEYFAVQVKDTTINYELSKDDYGVLHSTIYQCPLATPLASPPLRYLSFSRCSFSIASTSAK